VDISFTVCFVCVCVCTVTDLSREDKAAASNFARWFIGVLGRESPILGNLAPHKLPRSLKSDVCDTHSDLVALLLKKMTDGP